MNARTTYAATAAGVTATAVLGGLAVDVRSRWYRTLRVPRWNPPGAVFGPVWTVLYALIAVAAGRTFLRSPPTPQRRAYAGALGLNLTLNAGWSWLFFAGHRPAWATAEAAALEASTLDLVRRSWAVDRPAAVLLTPYALWCAFATVLTASIAARNRGASPRLRTARPPSA